MNSSKPHHAARILISGILSVLSVATVWSQRVAPAATPPAQEERRPSASRGIEPASPSAKGDESEDVTRLSPFVVQASSNDIGYYAENTLAGSRLNTNLGDLAASITVVTRQQMLDTAALDMNDIFLYEANTEGTGNYTAFTFNDQNTVDDSTSRTPATANRVRGIGSVDRAHNYYESLAGLPFDVYNTETVEINRGPNSLLFGIGSAAGIVNQSSSSANLKRESAEVSLRYGSEDSYRTSLRINKPLIPGKLAIFGAGLYDSRGFSRKPSHDISRRGYGAMTYAPGPKTTIRANYERYTGDSRRPNMVTPQDGISEWISAGRPTWDPLNFSYTSNGAVTALGNSNVANIPGLGMEIFGSRPQLYYDGGGPVLWMQAQLSSTGVQGPAFPFTLPQMVRTETAEFKARATTLPLYRTPGITNRSLYDWGEINLASSEVSKRRANVYNVELDQQVASNLFAQLGWYREDFKSYQAFANGWQMVRVDPNVRLLDGTMNPYLGRPYLTAVSTPSADDDFRNETFRASLAYTLDLTKRSGWTKWLGKHRVSAIAQRNEVEQVAHRLLLTTMSNHSWVNPTRRVQGGAAIVASSVVTPRVYIGGADGRITSEPGLIARGRIDIPLRHAVPATGGTFNWINEPAQIDLADNVNSNRTKKTTDSLTAGWQAYLWNDRIIPTLGFRRDKNISRATSPLTINPVTGLADLSGLDKFTTNNTLFGNTRTGGVVVKPLKWLSVFYNQSRNFTPASAQFDLFRKLLPLPTGKGKDYGVRFNLFDNKLILSINSFEASADKARGTPATTFVQRTARLEQVFILWAETLARTRLGSGASNSAIDQEVARISQLPVGFVSPDLGTVSSTSTVEARGMEVQLIYNPVRNWNIKATAGKQRTVYANIAPELDIYTAERLPVWMAATNNAGDRFWPNPHPDPSGGNTRPDSFWLTAIENPVALAKASEGKRTQGQREWQANVISTYRVVEGPLKGSEFGGGARWQDKAIIGYLGLPAGADGVVRKLDAHKPVYDSPRPAVDLWLSKTFTLPPMFGRNVRTKIQLNIRNVFEGGDRLEPIAINPDGQPNTYRIIDPREWYLTSTFTF